MNEIIRKNTCIMFTDVVGYTAMMERDELETFQVVLQLRKMLGDVHDLHDGKLLQFIGDGSLSTFDSADNAVAAAMAIRNKIPALLNIHLRIGLHYGAIIQDGTNTCGHAINLASRIEDSAEEDSILLSQSLVDQLENVADYPLVSQGDFQFKNVRQSLELYSIEEEEISSGMPLMTEKVPVRFLTRWSSYFASSLLMALFAFLIMGSNEIDSTMVEAESCCESHVHCQKPNQDRTRLCGLIPDRIACLLL